MQFKTLFIAHVPDAEPERDGCVLETGKYKLFVRLVKNQDEALKVVKNLVESDGIESIILCPGFTHKDVTEIQDVAGENVGITVARGDSKSSKIAMEAMKKAGWW